MSSSSTSDQFQSEFNEAANFFLYTEHDAYLKTFPDMWYKIFLTALFSSLFIHTVNGLFGSFEHPVPITGLFEVAALIAFATLRKHKFGKFFPIFILVMGIVPPLTSGIVSSAAIAFVYRASSLPMSPLYAMFWGLGQTALAACIGFTRILATL